MHDVNWWLMGLAFSLGLLLTLAMMIRRVTCVVPVASAVPAEAAAVITEEQAPPAAEPRIVSGGDD